MGAVTGVAFTTFGLVDTARGLQIGGGNEATPAVIAVGVVTGAALGATVLRRWPGVFIGALLGLVAGIWLRDNIALGPVQPPWVFLLLFGLPIFGATVGYLLHRSKQSQAAV